MTHIIKKRCLPHSLYLLGILGITLPEMVQSAPIYWSGNVGGTANTTWNTSNNNWNATSASQQGNTAFSNGSDVVFTSPLSNGSGNTITISGTVGPNSMIFKRDSGGSGLSWTFTGGTLNLPATITQEAGTSSAGTVDIGSAMVLSGNTIINGNRGSGNSRLTLSGNISGTGDIILNDAGDFRISGSSNTYNGTVYLNSGAWIIGTGNRVVGSGARTVHVGDGLGTARSAFVGLTAGGTGGLTSADTFSIKSDGYIRANAENLSGVRLSFDGGGVIGRESAGTSIFSTAQVTVLSGTATALGSDNGGTMNVQLLAGGGFDIAAGATFNLNSQFSKQTPATFITKTGLGTLNVGGALQTASTGFRVSEGVLNFQSTASLPSTTSIELAGGLLRMSGISLTLDSLTLTANSSLDFGSINGVSLLFGGDAEFGSYALSVQNYDFASGDRLRFWNGSSATLTSEEAAQISFGGGLYGSIDAMGYVTAIPEPALGGLLAMGFLTVLLQRRRRV